jgi:hypothetical protein
MLQLRRTVKKLVASKFRTTSNYNADCTTQRLFKCKQHLRKAHTYTMNNFACRLQVLHATNCFTYDCPNTMKLYCKLLKRKASNVRNIFIHCDKVFREQRTKQYKVITFREASENLTYCRRLYNTTLF